MARMKSNLVLAILAAAAATTATALEHNLVGAWNSPSRCSPPQTPLFAFYNRSNLTMMFDDGEEITIYCQAQVRTGSGLSWTLHRNMVRMPFLAGEAEDLPANLFCIRIPTAGLAPGFYDLRVRLEGLGLRDLAFDSRNAEKPARANADGVCTFGWKADDMALAEYAPDDLREFWDKAYGAYLRDVPLDARVEDEPVFFDAEACESYNVSNAVLPRCFDPNGVKFDEVVSYKVSWAGPDGGRVYAWLARPKAEGRFPAMLVLPGAGTGPRPRPIDHARHGFVAIDVQVHGIDCAVSGHPAVKGYNGVPPIIDFPPQSNCWYNIYLRAARGVDYLASLPFVDPERIVTAGGSQGGRLSIAVPAIDRRVAATVPAIPHGANLPYLEWYQRCNGSTRRADEEGRFEYRRDESLVPTDGMELEGAPPVPDTDEAKGYRYFDPMNLAAEVKCPALMNFGQIDFISFPSGAYSIFLRLGSADKTVVPVAGHGHDWWAAFDRMAYRWLDEKLGQSVEQDQ